jgi:two-component system response regulator NreC
VSDDGRLVVWPHELTARRQQVLVLTAQGYNDREIAQQLALNPNMVQLLRQRAQTLLHLRTRGDIVRWALQEGLLPQAPAHDPVPPTKHSRS